MLPEEIDFREEKKIQKFSGIALVFGLLAFGLTIAGIFLGLVLGVGWLLYLLGFICSILAIVNGAIAVIRTNKYPLPVIGSNQGRAGLILGIVFVSLSFLVAGALVVVLLLF